MAFDVDVALTLGERRIACTFASAAGITVLSGPSGAGKTSVLNMIAGLRRPARGHIAAAGRLLFDARRGVDLPAPARRAGYVFQEARLFPHLRVAANLDYGRRRGGRIDRAAVIAFLGLAPLLDRWPRSLSGGEARRVAIGRALLADPDFLLLDEPLSFLDAARRGEIVTALEQIRDTLALPMLLVTHEAGEAARLGERVVAMEAGGA